MENFLTPLITMGMIILSVAMIYIPVKISVVLERRQLVKEQRGCLRALSAVRTFSGYQAIPFIDHCALEEQLAEVNVKLAKLDEDEEKMWRIL